MILRHRKAQHQARGIVEIDQRHARRHVVAIGHPHAGNHAGPRGPDRIVARGLLGLGERGAGAFQRRPRGVEQIAGDRLLGDQRLGAAELLLLPPQLLARGSLRRFGGELPPDPQQFLPRRHAVALAYSAIHHRPLGRRGKAGDHSRLDRAGDREQGAERTARHGLDRHGGRRRRGLAGRAALAAAGQGQRRGERQDDSEGGKRMAGCSHWRRTVEVETDEVEGSARSAGRTAAGVKMRPAAKSRPAAATA